ncbi:MAG: hypothetical protein IT381_01205 [Deltaproteobacteria bacterium]|nr:hypothetical protein [Deltaproteobacteria bacterium]
MRLGEALVRDGIITQDELEEALRVHHEQGGKLGTTLVQLGFVEQKQLYDYLARRFAGAHMYKPGEEPPASAAALAAVPKKICEYYKLVPLSLEGELIHIALLDPTRLAALSAVKNATRKKVVPHVVSEDVIDIMLHRHYAIDPPRRKVLLKKAPITIPNAIVQPPAPAKSTLFGSGQELLGDHDDDDDIPLADAADLLEEIVDEGPPTLTLDVRSAIVPLPYDQAKIALMNAQKEEQVATALLGVAISVFQRAALLRVNAPARTLTAWDAGGNGVSRRMFEKVVIKIEPRSVLGVALSGRVPFLGNVAPTPENAATFAALGWSMPRSAFAIGLWMHTPVALLYCDNGADSLASANVNGVVDLASTAASILLGFKGR